MVLRIRLTGDPPVAHVSVFRRIDLADRLLFDRDPLRCLCCHNSGHADDPSGLDVLSERLAVDVVVQSDRHVLLGDAADHKMQLAADCLNRIPRVGCLKHLGVSDLLLELLRRQVAAVRICKRHTVLIDIVAVGALDLRDARAARCRHGDHVDPEDVLHARAGNRAVVLLRDLVETVHLRGSRRPRINGLLAGRNDVDAAAHALFDHRIDILHKAEQCDDRDIRIARIKHCIRVVGNDDPCLDSELRPVADILSDNLRIDIDRADNFRAVLICIPERIFAHLAAAILYDSHLSHDFMSSLILMIRL